MTSDDYEELIKLLDGRIDELTKPIPSRQILRFAEAIRTAELGDEDTDGTYSNEDYSNLLEAQNLVDDLLPRILEDIRAKSISQQDGWRFESVAAGHGDYGLCAICKSPYQHFGQTVKVHCLDMHPGAYHGACRECVRQYAPLEFVDSNDIDAWLKQNPRVSSKLESDAKRNEQQRGIIDAIRRYAHSTHYFGEVVSRASDWAKLAFGEWR